MSRTSLSATLSWCLSKLIKIAFVLAILAALFAVVLAVYGATQDVSIGEAWQMLWTAIRTAAQGK